jgi:hypothetical protein
MVLDVDLSMSNLTLVVPPTGCGLPDCRNSMSNIVDRHPPAVRGSAASWLKGRTP